MRIIIIDKISHKPRINKILEWLIHMLVYAIVLIMMSLIFKKTFQIDSSYFGLWSLIAAILIYALNRTIKPILVWLTLPITAITLGLFYPFINVLILNIVDFILGEHFNIGGIWMTFLIAILISFMNELIEFTVLRPIIRRFKNE
jgi:putative membrane protein